MFCRGLKKHGARVLAIIDTDYNNLSPELRSNIDDCFRVSSFHNYNEVYQAVAWFAYKYGKPDWIESNNEAWLALDARLRDDFHVTTGFNLAKIEELQSKAAMKKYYEQAGIPVAPYILPENYPQALEFAEQHGFNLVLKPDHGVGASFTWHIHDEQELRQYWIEACELDEQMILEQYIDGDVVTLDGVCDANGDIRFLGTMAYVSNCMDSVQNHDSIGTYYDFTVSDERRAIAQRVVNSFDIRNRFFHGEYFELRQDTPGVGHKGDLIGLEMNFRPPGGFCPELINYSYNEDIYEIWAQVLLEQKCDAEDQTSYSAGFVGRRKGVAYQYSVEELMDRYRENLIGVEILPEAFAQAMGDVTIKARFTDPAVRDAFYRDSFMKKD